ncbi:hypothetical protein FJR48_06410 [Sulfurimonas lithotrophica]|uniref:Uncharacterized protein n=1 Tax=Sulfurimonas lithotrophica TaxID=2590022 RepID=A0A5P8P0X8_9BACT|nr:hypothetical protein [Sulfurimonas lithotrophica]QFR49376.1 hypothetical protein FJR48_06410 [Sulfurimonas lithotrophica]
MDSKLLTWKEVRIIVDHYFSFWIDGEDKIWAKMMWSALESAGLTIYRTDDEGMVVRSRIAILALIYQEFCVRSQLSNYDEANFRGLKQHHYKEIFSDSVEQINEQIELILNALNKEYQDGVLFILMYESVFRGSHGSLTMKQVDDKIEEIKDVILKKETCAEYEAFIFTMYGCSIREFESLAIDFI